MRRQKKLTITLKLVNMEGGGYRNFLEQVKTDGTTNCLAKFIIIDGDRALAEEGEKKNLRELLNYCILQNKNGKILVYALLIFGSLIMIFPFVWMFLTSFKTPAESMSIPATLFPSAFRLDKYIEVLGKLPFAKLYWNTILLVFFRVVCAVVFSSMAGYAFAKLKFRGKGLLFTIVLMQMSLPYKSS